MTASGWTTEQIRAVAARRFLEHQRRLRWWHWLGAVVVALAARRWVITGALW